MIFNFLMTFLFTDWSDCCNFCRNRERIITEIIIHNVHQMRIPCSKPLGGSMVDSAFHPSKVNKMSTRDFWELSGKKYTASLKWP